MALAGRRRHRHVTPPASLSIDVLPCGGTPIAATTCTGGRLHGSRHAGRDGRTPSARARRGRDVGRRSPGSTPRRRPRASARASPRTRTGASSTSGRSRRTRRSSSRSRRPRSATCKWFQTDVCLGTNLRFITAIQSLANLAPGRDVRQRRRAPGPLVGAPAEHPAHRAGSRAAGSCSGRTSVSRSQRRGRQRRDRVPRAVRPELGGLHDGRQGRLRPEVLGLGSRVRGREAASGPPSPCYAG